MQGLPPLKNTMHGFGRAKSLLLGSRAAYQGEPNGHAESFVVAPGGIDAELRHLRVDERSEIERYGEQALSIANIACQSVLLKVIADENEHYKVLSALIRARPPLPILDGLKARKALDELLAARKKRNPEAPGWLNDAIYAAHDGLGSIFSIVSGVAGATLGKSHYVLIAGLAGMVGIPCELFQVSFQSPSE